jgi:hypothetical protein
MTLKAVLAAAQEWQGLNDIVPTDAGLPTLEAITNLHSAAIEALLLEPAVAKGLQTIRDRARRIADAYPSIDEGDAWELGAAVAIVARFMGEQMPSSSAEPSPPPGGTDLVN